MKKRIAIFCGGKSIEHEISIISAFEVLNSLDENYEGYIVYISKENKMYVGEYLQYKDNYKDLDRILKKGKEVHLRVKDNRYFLESKYRKILTFDIAYLCVHGKGMEDGTLAAIMEYYDILYVGNNVLSSSIGQDKWLSKFLLHSINVPTLPCFYINPSNYDEEYIEKKVNNIGFPLIVKANHLGSSIGIKKVDNYNDLYSAINIIGTYDSKIIIEKCLTNFKEVNQAITLIGNEDVYSSVEIIYPDSIYDYNDKYVKPKSQKEICEDNELIEKVSKLSSKIYKSLGLSSIVRIDYLYDIDANKIYFSEVNTIPGSLSKRLFESNNIMFDELLTNEIQKAISNNFKKKNNIRTLENKIMSSVLNMVTKK